MIIEDCDDGSTECGDGCFFEDRARFYLLANRGFNLRVAFCRCIEARPRTSRTSRFFRQARLDTPVGHEPDQRHGHVNGLRQARVPKRGSDAH